MTLQFTKDLKIMLIEDNIKDATIFTEIVHECEEFNIEMDHFNRLDAGLTSLVENQYDLLFLDLTLPDSVGVHTFQTIKAMVPGLPIIVLTGTVLKRDELKSCLDIADEYLVKGYIDSVSLTKSLVKVANIKNKFLQKQKAE